MRHRAKSAFFDYWEKPLLYLAVSCGVLLFVAQILLYKDSTRQYLSWVDKLEGQTVLLDTPGAHTNPVTIVDNSPVAEPLQVIREHRTITVKMLSPAKRDGVYLTVNGETAGDFKQGEVDLTVYEGDYLEIDASFLHEKGVFIVAGAGLASPVDGIMLEGKETKIPVGQVKFKTE